jgi:hypothetical protein
MEGAGKHRRKIRMRKPKYHDNKESVEELDGMNAR